MSDQETAVKTKSPARRYRRTTLVVWTCVALASGITGTIMTLGTHSADILRKIYREESYTTVAFGGTHDSESFPVRCKVQVFFGNASTLVIFEDVGTYGPHTYTGYGAAWYALQDGTLQIVRVAANGTDTFHGPVSEIVTNTDAGAIVGAACLVPIEFRPVDS